MPGNLLFVRLLTLRLCVEARITAPGGCSSHARWSTTSAIPIGPSWRERPGCRRLLPHRASAVLPSRAATRERRWSWRSGDRRSAWVCRPERTGRTRPSYRSRAGRLPKSWADRAGRESGRVRPRPIPGWFHPEDSRAMWRRRRTWSGAAIGHVVGLNLRHRVEQLGAEMIDAAGAVGAEAELARAAASQCDQVADVLYRQRRRNDQQERRRREQNDRDEIANRVVVDPRIHVGVRSVR